MHDGDFFIALKCKKGGANRHLKQLQSNMDSIAVKQNNNLLLPKLKRRNKMINNETIYILLRLNKKEDSMKDVILEGIASNIKTIIICVAIIAIVAISTNACLTFIQMKKRL